MEDSDDNEQSIDSDEKGFERWPGRSIRRGGKRPIATGARPTLLQPTARRRLSVEGRALEESAGARVQRTCSSLQSLIVCQTRVLATETALPLPPLAGLPSRMSLSPPSDAAEALAPEESEGACMHAAALFSPLSTLACWRLTQRSLPLSPAGVAPHMPLLSTCHAGGGEARVPEECVG